MIKLVIEMTGLFGFLFFVGLITTPISGIVWIVKKLRHKATKAKIVCLVAALVTVVSFTGIGITYEPTEKVEEPPTAGSTEPAQSDAQTATEPPTEIEPTDTTPEPEDTPQTATEPPETTPPATSTPQEETTPAATLPEGTEPPAASEPVLVNLPVQERPVMNGTGTERIGTWARIITTKEYLATIPGQALYEHLEAMSGNDYNWVNVTFGDGTGLYCYMDGYLIEYGYVDETGGGAVEPGDGVDVRYFHFDSETGTYIEDE